MVEAVEQRATPVRGASLWPMSVEAYHILGEAGAIPKNTELLYGFVYTKMPKSPFHTALLYRILLWLQKLELPGLWIRSEQPLTFIDSEPEPDISLVKGAISDFWTGHPQSAELVIEICITSHEYDRSKLRAYATANVKECWLILAPEKKIEVYSDPVDGAYTKSSVHGPGGAVQSRSVPNVSLDLNGLFQK